MGLTGPWITPEAPKRRAGSEPARPQQVRAEGHRRHECKGKVHTKPNGKGEKWATPQRSHVWRMMTEKSGQEGQEV